MTMQWKFRVTFVILRLGLIVRVTAARASRHADSCETSLMKDGISDLILKIYLTSSIDESVIKQ